MKKYYLDLFSGIGGFALAAYWAGLRFDEHYFSEIDEYAINVYQKRFPDALSLGDITKINCNELPKGEWIISGGFPCQPHSVAGKKQASKDERDLWPECRRILCELQPRIALFENVPGLFISDGGRFFNGILSDIHSCGYDAEWQIISAADVGAPHLRKRIWIVAYPGCEHGARKSQLSEYENADRAKEAAQLERSTECNEYGFTTNAESGESGFTPKQQGRKNLSRSDCKITNTNSDRLQRLRKKRNGAGSLGLHDRENIYWKENWVEVAARFCRVDDGVSNRVDRLKCLGNAIVPQIATMIFNLRVFDHWRVA